jgi:aspartate racemase
LDLGGLLKTLGIIGGIGPESTIEYYRRLITLYRRKNADGSYPHLILNSINLTQMLGMISANQLPELAQFLLAQIESMARAGADFALIAANAPHLVFPEIEKQSPIPLISIVQSAADHATHLGVRKLALFGAKFTMQASFYTDVFSRHGISLAVPNLEEQDYIHEKYFGELVHGTVLPETRRRLEGIVESMKARNAIEGLIVGGTELSLIFREPQVCGLLLLDTTQIHVEAAIARMLT